jgi:hypothetical protein
MRPSASPHPLNKSRRPSGGAHAVRGLTLGLVVALGAFLVVAVVVSTLGVRRAVKYAARDGSLFTRALAEGFGVPAAEARLKSVNNARFEGGNIGAVQRTGPRAFDISLRSDNDDALPAFWRQWFYLGLDDVATEAPTTITIRGAGQWHFYVPYYSYDGVTWQPFDSRDVKQPTKLTLRVTKRFTRSKVWLARFEPYTYSRLSAWLSRTARHPHVTTGAIGKSPEGRVIPFLSITDPSATGPKSRVVIHARTHPGEVGSSFLLEGLVEAMLRETPKARALRRRIVLDVVPMLNVDGVVAGNYRVNIQGINLEGKWYALDPDGDPATPAANPFPLDVSRTPTEVKAFHSFLAKRLKDGIPVSMALNLHSSGGEPRDGVFAFPHFGPRKLGYDLSESSLYERQLVFLKHLSDAAGRHWFNRPVKDGSRVFTRRSLPESWWWRNYKDRVMALTLEATYGLAGRSGRWIRPDDLRHIGAGMTTALARYHGQDGGKDQTPKAAVSASLAH